MELGHINASGFPLQIAVRHAVAQTKRQHHWSVRYEEHAWRDSKADKSGFIDLVFERGNVNLVVECKRVRDTAWIFLIDDPAQLKRRHAKCCTQAGRQRVACEWVDVQVAPQTPQSQYCVIPGSDSKSPPMIERVGGELVASTEALAYEDWQLTPEDAHSQKFYFPVIVTTAALTVGQFDPATISLVDGTLPNVTSTEIPYLRFRKQLQPRVTVPANQRDGGSYGIAIAKENTVFVVNAQYLTEFLRDFDVDVSPHVGGAQ